MAIHDYPHPALTVDVVLLAAGSGDLEVLLIQREGPPFEGRWALPGGFVELGESPEDAASRELAEETGVHGVRLEQMRAFGDPGRDPRGHVVTLVFWGLLDHDWSPGGLPCPVDAGSDAAVARWWPTGGLPPLAFDHSDILAYALRQLPVERANAGAPPTA
jgi:8-oxo-dGTP diphosphatase